MAGVVKELSEYFSLPKDEIGRIMSMREEILELEYKIWRTANPNGDRLSFYKESKFMLFSNAQDELERDNDTDWQDMVLDLDFSYRSVLDFGCGIGSAGLNLAKVKKNLVFYFVEPNQYSRQFLQWRCVKKVIVQTITSSIPCTQFDLVIAWGVFEHIEDNEAARIFDLLLSNLSRTGKLFLKNFYNQTDDYLLHYRLGPKMKQRYQENKWRIIYARHSH